VAVDGEGLRMAIKDIKFQDGQPGELEGDYEKHLNSLLRNLTVALANVGKWETVREIATEALAEGMVGLGLNQVKTDNLQIDVTDDGTTVEVRMLDQAKEEVYH
jgi:hypothetical protein